jgi:hypothetical protein
MPFLFKGLEKLVKRQLEQTVLKDDPLSPHQHAFRKGFSTESALSSVMSFLEKAVLKGGLAIGVFLDIKGAFDNVTTEGIEASLKKRKFPPTMINWYINYLKSRSINISIKGTKLRRLLKRGFAQGGVLSTIIWNVIFDELLALFKNTLVKIRAYADDVLPLARGKNILFLLRQLQTAINKADCWAKEKGLTFSPAKTVAILFTRKRKINISTIAEL